MKIILIGLITVGIILFIILKIIIPIAQSCFKQNIQDLNELEKQTKETLDQYNQTKKTVEDTKKKVDQINSQFK